MKRRAEFQKLMEDAKCGLFEMVVVKDVSRFARNTVDFLQSIRKLKDMGIGTIFVTNNMTTLGDSEFILTIFSVMAQEESANLSKRVKFGKEINSKKGRVPPKIFGYDGSTTSPCASTRKRRASSGIFTTCMSIRG